MQNDSYFIYPHPIYGAFPADHPRPSSRIEIVDPVTSTRHYAIVRTISSASIDGTWYPYIENATALDFPYLRSDFPINIINCGFLGNKLLVARGNAAAVGGFDWNNENNTQSIAPLISENAVNWRPSYDVTTPGAKYEWDLTRGIASSEELGILVRVGNNTAYSYDGYNWFSASMDNARLGSAVCWSPELNKFVAVGRAGHAWESTDGIYWKITTSSKQIFTSGGSYGKLVYSGSHWFDVTWDSVNSKFIAVGSYTEFRINKPNFFSNDSYPGILWIEQAATAYTGSIMVSSDGVNWQITPKAVSHSIISNDNPINYDTFTYISKVTSGNGITVATRNNPANYDGTYAGSQSLGVSSDGGVTWDWKDIPGMVRGTIGGPCYASDLNKFYVPYLSVENYENQNRLLSFYTSSNGVDWGTLNAPYRGYYSHGTGYTEIQLMIWSSHLQKFVALTKYQGTAYYSNAEGTEFYDNKTAEVGIIELTEMPNSTLYSTPLLWTSSYYSGFDPYFLENVYPYIQFRLLQNNTNPYSVEAEYPGTASLGIIIDSASLGLFPYNNTTLYTEDIIIDGIRYLRETDTPNPLDGTDEGVSGLFGPSTYISNGTFTPVSNTSYRFTTTTNNSSVTNIPNHLSGSTGLTFDDTPTYSRYDDGDDAYWEINLPFSVEYNGTTYSTLYVGSNSHITFDEGYEYNIDPNYPSVNKIGISSYDNYCTALYYGQEGNRFRIRWEGTRYSYQAGGSKIWEMTFYQDTPNQIDLHIGDNPNFLPPPDNIGNYHDGFYEYPGDNNVVASTITLTSASTSTFSASLKSAGRDNVAVWFGSYSANSYKNQNVGMVLNINNGTINYLEDARNMTYPNSYNMASSTANKLVFLEGPFLNSKPNGYWELAFKVGFDAYAYGTRIYSGSSTSLNTVASASVFSIGAPYTFPATASKLDTPPVAPVPPVTPHPQYWWRADIGLTTSSWTATSGSIDFLLRGVTTASSATGLYLSQSMGSSSVALSAVLPIHHAFIRAEFRQNITEGFQVGNKIVLGSTDITGSGVLGTGYEPRGLLIVQPGSTRHIIRDRNFECSTGTTTLGGVPTGSKFTYIDFSVYPSLYRGEPGPAADQGQTPVLAIYTQSFDSYVPRPFYTSSISAFSNKEYPHRYEFPSGSKLLIGGRPWSGTNTPIIQEGPFNRNVAHLYLKEIALFTSSISIAEASQFVNEMMERWP